MVTVHSFMPLARKRDGGVTYRNPAASRSSLGLTTGNLSAHMILIRTGHEKYL